MHMFTRGPFLAPEDVGAGASAEPAAETTPAESIPASTVAEPAAGSAEASPSQAPAWNGQEAFQQLSSEVAGWREFYTKDQAQRQSEAQADRQRLMNYLAPDLAKKNAPPTASIDDLRRFGTEMYEQMEARAIRREHDAELSVAKEKYPAVFELHPGLVHMMRAQYAEDGTRPVAIAKALHEKIESMIAAKNAAIVAQKQVAQKQVRGTGAPGKTPPAATEDHGARGRGRLDRLRFGGQH